MWWAGHYRAPKMLKEGGLPPEQWGGGKALSRSGRWPEKDVSSSRGRMGARADEKRLGSAISGRRSGCG